MVKRYVLVKDCNNEEVITLSSTATSKTSECVGKRSWNDTSGGVEVPPGFDEPQAGERDRKSLLY